MPKAKITNWSKDDKTKFFWGTFFGLITSLLSSSLPFLIKFATDKFENNKSNQTILNIGLVLLIMVVIGLFSVSFSYISKIFLTKLSSKKIAEVRQQMFSNIQKASPSDLKSHDSSSLISRLSLDIFNYSLYYNYMLINVIPSIIRWIVFTIIIFVLNYFIGLLLIVLCLVLFISSILIARKSIKYYDYSIKNIDDITQIIQENISGIRVVKSFNLKEKQLSRFEKINQEIVFNSSKAEIKTFLTLPLSITLVNAVGILILIVGAANNFASFSNKLDYGDIAAIFSYSYLILWSTFDVVLLYIFYSRSLMSQKRIYELINLKFNSINDSGFEFENGNLKFDNVSFKYIDQTHDYVLKDLNFEIKMNSKVGIIGATGSGKSSLLYLIARLWDTSKGTISINNKDIKEINTSSLLKNISFAFQNKLLFSGSIKENIKFSNEHISDEKILEIIEICQLKEFVNSKKEGLDYKLEEFGQNLSGGQKQRVNIARTLARDAKIYIFDDTTSALDNITEQKILSSIFKEKTDSTLIISSQKISTIQTMDQIIVLDKGEISGIGNHEYLLKNNQIYQELYELQIKKGSK